MNFLSFFFQAEDGIRYWSVTGVQTCALPIYLEEYKVPTAADVLSIVHAQVNLPDPEANPTGAKGIGEPPRSEERRVGKECRYQRRQYHEKKEEEDCVESEQDTGTRNPARCKI